VRSRILIVLLVAGCARDERKVAAPAAVDPVEDALRAARAVLPGPQKAAEKATVTVRRGGETVESLAEESVVERGAGGELHATYANSRDHGRELFAAGGIVWVRPRYGKFHRRPPARPDEAERAAAEIGGLLAAQLELCAAGLAVEDAGATTVAGRPARRLVLKRGAPRPLPGPGWRASVSIEALEGELVVDDATGALLGGRLAARAGFVRDGERLEMTLDAAREVVPGAVAITLPAEEQSSPTPLRATEFEDREELLSGLAAPGRKSPAPAARGATP
jgi:hypothetical protein